MSDSDVLKALFAGKRVRLVNWLDGQWIELRGQHFYTQDNERCFEFTWSCGEWEEAL